MATQSTTSPSPGEDNPLNPEPAVEEQQSKARAKKENSDASVFVNSEPMREEQVQNAVKFLSHPNVRGSPVIYRRSFLERKGLTKEEIDEAFRRVPDPPPNGSTQPAVRNQDGLKSSSIIQSQAPIQTLQPAAAAHAGVISKAGMFSQFHWTYVFLAAGILAASGAGTVVFLKKTFVPRLKSWIRKVILEEDVEKDLMTKAKSKPSPAEEAAAAAKAAAAAAADVARDSQEMVISKTEDKRCFEELMSLLNVQVREMKSMSGTIRKLEGRCNINGRIPPNEHEDHRIAVTSSKQACANGIPGPDSLSARSTSPPPSAEPSVAPHPKSYMEIIAMVQRGEKPPNIREINDLPPNPNQPLPNPSVAPRPKPWEIGQAQNSSSYDIQSQEGSNRPSFKFQDDRSLGQTNGGISEPWWQRQNARITEIEAEDEQGTGPSDALMNELSVQRAWVPPLPPPVAMPEAAAAIRQPKRPLAQKEQPTDNQLLDGSSDVNGELHGITKIAESGGAIEINGENSEMNIS